MKKRDLIVILGIMLIAAVLLCTNLLASKHIIHGDSPSSSDSVSSAAGQPEDGSESVVSGAYSESVVAMTEEYLAMYPAESYLLVTTANNTYSPIPLNEDNAFRIKQADGSENVIHIGKNSFYMESSNCENQNCVYEGEVTLDNKDTRILLNMVLCLPHQLSLEMLTREEAKDCLLELYAEQEAMYSAMEGYMQSQSQTGEQDSANGG